MTYDLLPKVALLAAMGGYAPHLPAGYLVPVFKSRRAKRSRVLNSNTRKRISDYAPENIGSQNTNVKGKEVSQ